MTIKRQRRMLSLLLALLLAFPAMPVPTGYSYGNITTQAAAKKVKIVNVTTGTLTIQEGESFQLKTNRSGLKWKSSDKKVAIRSISWGQNAF